MSGIGTGWRWLLALATLVGLSAAACGDSDAGPADGDDAAESNQFVGLAVDDATELAESEGRLWRISRDGEEFFGMDAALVEGRVTFEVDDGIVTSAEIETMTDPGETVPDNGATEDLLLARLQADAVVRLVTVDHGFASDTFPFDTVIVSSVFTDDTGRQVEPLALELIAADIQADAAVKFIDNPDAEIADLAASETSGVAVVRIEDIRIDGDRAEIDLGLWCGNACAVFLTYEAEFANDQWTVAGTVGPIVVS